MSESNPAELYVGQAEIIDSSIREDKKFQKCIHPNGKKITNEYENKEGTCSDIQERCDQEHNGGSLFSYVPFNSPQDGFGDILSDQDSFERSSVLDEVSKTLTNLYCDNDNTDVGSSQRRCQKNDGTLKLTKNISSDHSDVEEDQCLKKLSQSLSQCEISQKDNNGQLKLEYLQQCISSQQVKFACKLKLMPSVLPDMTQNNDTSSDICFSSCGIEKTAQCSQEKIISPTAIQQSKTSSDESSDSSSKSSLVEHEPIRKCATNTHNGINVCRSESTLQTTSAKSNIPLTCLTNIQIKEDDVEMETSLEKGLSIFNTHEFDKEKITDVELVMDSLVEDCCIVPVEHDENVNNHINQYSPDQSASDENRLDMRAENENELYSEHTSLAVDLNAGSGHTNSSPINEANIDVMEIGEPSPDYQVPLALPCHDNYQQEIGKSHENVAALAEYSSQNDLCEVEACIQTSPKTSIFRSQISQVSEEPQEDALCVSQTCSQKCVALKITCEKEANVHVDWNLNEASRGDHISSENSDLIKNYNGNNDTQSEVSEIQVQVSKTATSNTNMFVSDMPFDLKLIEVETKNEDYITTNLLNEKLISNLDLTRLENLKSRLEMPIDRVDVLLSFNHNNKFEGFQKENVTEENEHEKDILVSPANDDIAHSFSLQALDQETREKVLTMHSMINEGIMDFKDSKAQDLPSENVSVSKCVTQESNTNASMESLENDMGIVPNIPISQSGLSSDKSSYSSTHNTDCLNYQPTKTASSVQPNIKRNNINDQEIFEENICSDQHADYQIMGTQQFTAALSQANIGDYLGVKFEASESFYSTSDEAYIVPELGHDLLVSRNDFHSECEDVSMYENDVSFKLKDKVPETMECVTEQAPCFKWKYAPSLNLDELPATDARNSDEDTLLTVLPLKTCTRPIRVGLSKKYRAKPLHKTQRL